MRDRKQLAWLLCSLAILLEGFAAGHSPARLVRTAISVQASAANESGHNWRNKQKLF